MAAATVRRPAWLPAAAALGAAALALGVALLVPRLFSDPVGVDPFSVRLAAVSLVLVAAAAWSARLAPTRGVLLAVAAIAAPFCLWSATPRVLDLLTSGHISYPAEYFWAGVAQMALTALLLGWLWLAVRPGPPPALRLAHFGRGALVASVTGVALLLLVSLALPATLLGRLGIPPLALARDLPWSGPGNVLEAAAQELQFRGALLGVLETSMPPWAANLGQAALFGLAHVAVQYEGPAGPFIPVTVALGLVLGWVTQRTGSIWPAIIVHAVADVAVAVAILPGLYGS